MTNQTVVEVSLDRLGRPCSSGDDSQSGRWSQRFRAKGT